MANVVIAYTGNVCSTPMVEYARMSRDIFRPLIDYRCYNAALEALFGEVAAVDEQSAPAVRKGGLDLLHCANPGMVTADGALRKMEARYRDAAAELNNVLSGN